MKNKLFTTSEINMIKNSFQNKSNCVELTYLPRETTYLVRDFVKIKQEDGSWKEGVSYKEFSGQDIYVREFDFFESGKWEWRFVVGG